MSSIYFIGDNAQAAHVSTTQTISVGHVSAAGDTLCVATGTGASSMSVSSMSDSKGNSYSLRIGEISPTSGQNTFIYVADNSNNSGGTKALALTDTITIVWNNSNGGQQAIAFGLNGMLGAPVDQTPNPTANAGSTAPSITSGTLNQANEIVVTVVGSGHAGGTITWGSGFSNVDDLAGSGSSGSYLAVGSKTVTSTSAVTGSGTLSGSAPWNCLMISFESAPALSITTTSLPGGRQGLPYSYTVAASGGAGVPYTWSLNSGSLPAGLSLDAGSGTISGTVTGGTAAFVLKVTDTAGNTATKSLSISITQQGQPYFLASFAGPPSSNLSPSATVPNNIFDGDTIRVGVLATAGAVSSVTDTAGNGYTLEQFETTNTGCQLYTFASYGSSPFTYGLPQTNTGRFGATVNDGEYKGSGSTLAAAGIFDDFFGGNFNAALSAEKSFWGGKGQPAIPTGPNSNELGLINAGCQLWLCIKPTYPGTAAEKAALKSALQAYQSAISAANNGSSLVVVLWNEPQNDKNNPPFINGASDYIAMQQYYYPTIHALGIPVAYVSEGSGGPSAVKNWFPSGSCDIVGVDYYANTYFDEGQTGATFTAAQNLANNNNLPLALGEFGTASGQTDHGKSNFKSYISFLQGAMVANLSSTAGNSAVMWYNGPDGGLNEIKSSNDYRIALIQQFQQAITSTPLPTITATYTSTSSAQAFIAIGDDNVQALADIKVGATGTGTTASVATGTLGFSGERITAFIANLSAGGVPLLGDSLTSLGQVETGTTAYLTAATKSVFVTASDTPSATIASTTWSISVVTDPLNPITVQGQSQGSFVNGIVSIPYSGTASASGGTAPYTWAITSGSLPPGIALTGSTGIISGTPITAGTYTFTIQATDVNGQTGNASQTIVIYPGGNPGLEQTARGTNVLTLFDSEFEVPGETWAPDTNAGVPFRTNVLAFSGSYSLGWVSTVNGDTRISTSPYTALGNMPYTFAAFFFTEGIRACSIGVEWYDSNNVLIETVLGLPSIIQPGIWSPVQAALTAPANAASFQVVVDNPSATIGETTFIDLVYIQQTSAQVLIDWVNPPFEPGSTAGNAFMDVAPWVRKDQTITITRGRQDAISEIQPTTGSFTLQNDIGQWTGFSTNAYPVVLGGSVSLQYRCQINFADENGSWWTRLDGPISEIDYTFDNTGNTSTAVISVTDVMAALNRQDVMSCWTQEQVLNNGPAYHWDLNDSGTVGGAGVAVESSGNNGPPMRLSNSDSTKVATISWQDTSGGVETLADAVSPSAASDGSQFWLPGTRQPTSALRGLVSGVTGPYTTPMGSILLTPSAMVNPTNGIWPTGTQTAQNTFVGNLGYMLSTELTTPIAPTAIGSDYSVECWFAMDPTISKNLTLNYGPFIAIGLGSSRKKTNLLAGLFLNAGALKFECATYNQPPAFLGLNWPSVLTAPTAIASTSATFTADLVKIPHHLVITFTGDPVAPAVTVYVDGVEIGSGFTLPTGQTYDTITIGGAYGGAGAWFGNLSLASVYNYAMPESQITTDCQLGQYGMWEMPTDDCIAQLSQFANVPPFWNNLSAQHFGLSLTDYIDVTGSNAISMMQQYEQAEHGLLFVNALGALTFHPRNWRMGYGGPDLYLPPDTYDASLQYELIDQFMCNEMAVTGPNTLGAKATTVLTNTSTGTTQTETTTSTLVQASFINTESQDMFGVYATNPVSSPLALPLITWSRGYAALGLASFSYWPDPTLSDFAAWNANSRSQPWFLPATVTIDLLTLDPTEVGIGISDLYALEIDNMIAPNGALPTSFPTSISSVEWFIEGIQETYSLQSRTIEFYTSPAQYQRAWIPGDPTYGVLGSTTAIGISAADMSSPQADGKDVSHDAGGPYWPPTFGPEMNNPSGTSSGSTGEGGFVGSNDMRGLAANLQAVLAPPICAVSAISQTQTINNGSLTSPDIFWDTILVDSIGGMGAVPGWPNWYVCLTPGFYEIDASFPFSVTGSGLGGYSGQAWIVVAQAAAQAVVANTGNPRTVNQYICPVGETVRFTSASMTPICAPTTRMYLGLGDMIALAAEQNYTSSRGSSTAAPSPIMSIRYTGLGKVDDRAQSNSSIANGGTVTNPSHGVIQQANFSNTHTYAYQGEKGWGPFRRRNSDQACFQGPFGDGSEGSLTSQVAFNVSLIQSTLSGHTPLSATLTATNSYAFYSTGAKMMLGTTRDIPGGRTYNPGGSFTEENIIVQRFPQGQPLTFAIPLKFVNGFNTGGVLALVLGDAEIKNKEYAGQWNGGPATWTLTVNYV